MGGVLCYTNIIFIRPREISRNIHRAPKNMLVQNIFQIIVYKILMKYICRIMALMAPLAVAFVKYISGSIILHLNLKFDITKFSLCFLTQMEAP